MVSSCLSQCRIHSRKNISHENSDIDRGHMGQRAQMMMISFYDLILSLLAHCGSDVAEWSRIRRAIGRMAEETDCRNHG